MALQVTASPPISHWVQHVLENDARFELVSLATPHPHYTSSPAHMALMNIHKAIQVQIIWNQKNYSMSPDLIVDTSTVSYVPALQELDQLNNWNADEPDALLRVLRQLADLFQSHFSKKVREIPNPRIQLELERLEELFPTHPKWVFTTAGAPQQQAQQQQQQQQQRKTIVDVIFPMFSNEPGPKDGVDVAIQFSVPSNTALDPQISCFIKLDRFWTDILSSLNVVIPNYHSSQLAADYTLETKQQIFRAFKTHTEYVLRKRSLLKHLTFTFRERVAEYDSINCNKISILFPKDSKFQVLFTLDLTKFPTNAIDVSFIILGEIIPGEPADFSDFRRDRKSVV